MTTFALPHIRSSDARSFAVGAAASLRSAIGARLTRKGPRAYADTHDVATSLLAAPPCRVVDLAAGRGELSVKLAALGHDVVSVERYTAQFEATNTIVDADLGVTWPFEDGRFDAAMAVEIIEHVENPRLFLRELARVLVPRGIAIVSTPNVTSLLSRALYASMGQMDLFFNHPWRLRDPYSSLVHGHITPLPRWLLTHHAKDAGFEVEACAYSRAYFPGVPWRVNPLPRGPAFGRVLLLRLRKRG